ncbi:hypothetical protein [Paraburkholderia sp. BL10I2N1]|uniref:hyaluronate lyase N-terminal domain-containing protein n=1 Tax=Paraburkholderia sp. BL10I2N1 TaxID=1938796 RepID=UPI00105F6422|nr:hypothetical protein [Paraburkholderia sp. BL10I2N1]
MSTQFKLRRGTLAQHQTFTGAQGEATVDTDTYGIHVHDGATAGGHVIAMVTVATFAALPATPQGIYLVLADETKGGTPSMYFFTATHRYWLAMVQDA